MFSAGLYGFLLTNISEDGTVILRDLIETPFTAIFNRSLDAFLYSICGNMAIMMLPGRLGHYAVPTVLGFSALHYLNKSDMF